MDKTLFFQDGVRRIDYVFAYKLQDSPDDKKVSRREVFETNLRKSGLALEKETVQVRSWLLRMKLVFWSMCYNLVPACVGTKHTEKNSCQMCSEHEVMPHIVDCQVCATNSGNVFAYFLNFIIILL